MCGNCTAVMSNKLSQCNRKGLARWELSHSSINSNNNTNKYLAIEIKLSHQSCAATMSGGRWARKLMLLLFLLLLLMKSTKIYVFSRLFCFFLVWDFLYTFQYYYFCCCCCCCSNNLYRLSVITVRRFSLPHASFYTINTRFCCCCYFYCCHNYSSGGWGVLLTLFLVVIESCCCVQCVDMDI